MDELLLRYGNFAPVALLLGRIPAPRVAIVGDRTDTARVVDTPLRDVASAFLARLYHGFSIANITRLLNDACRPGFLFGGFGLGKTVLHNCRSWPDEA
jgi:hypothetical protein